MCNDCHYLEELLEIKGCVKTVLLFQILKNWKILPAPLKKICFYKVLQRERFRESTLF